MHCQLRSSLYISLPSPAVLGTCWKAEQGHCFRCLRALWKMNKHIQPFILGLYNWGFQEKNIFLVEKTFAIKEGLSQESAILVGSGSVGKHHSWWQQSPAAPSAGNKQFMLFLLHSQVCMAMMETPQCPGTLLYLQLQPEGSSAISQGTSHTGGCCCGNHKVPGSHRQRVPNCTGTDQYWKVTSSTGAPTTPNSPSWTQFWLEISTVARELRNTIELRTFLWPESLWVSDMSDGKDIRLSTKAITGDLFTNSHIFIIYFWIKRRWNYKVYNSAFLWRTFKLWKNRPLN